MAGLIFAIVIVQAIFSCYAACLIADARDRSVMWWGFVGLVLGVFGVFITYTLPPVYGGSCPRCAEPVRIAATVCPYCQLPA
jgi:drug/metabolite transporter superfamily protein YnfA